MEPIPPELCALHPDLPAYGFYRKLNNGQEEFISYCNPKAANWFGVNKDELNKMLDDYLPKEQPSVQ